MPKIAAPRPPEDGRIAAAMVKAAPCAFRIADRLERLPTPFYRRDLLPLDEPIAGPAIILQIDSTTVVPPAASLYADHSGNLILRLGVDP